MTVTPMAFRKAAYLGLGLSVLALILVCLLVAGPEHTFKFAASWPGQIITGYVATIFLVEIVGIRLRGRLAQSSAAGALFALFLFLVGILVGSASSMFFFGEFNLRALVMAPLFYVGVWGFIPAIIIGLIGSRILQKCSRIGDGGQ